MRETREREKGQLTKIIKKIQIIKSGIFKDSDTYSIEYIFDSVILPPFIISIFFRFNLFSFIIENINKI